MLALCVLFARQFFHDLDRFGREGIPWARMLVLAEAMSVTGYGLVGTRWGLLTGLVVMPPFGLGRWLGKREARRGT